MTDGSGHLYRACRGTGESRMKDPEPGVVSMPIKAPPRPKLAHAGPNAIKTVTLIRMLN